MFKINSVNDLWNHIAYVILYAPDRFPKEDFLCEEDQMTLDRSFDQLRQGVDIAYSEKEFADNRKDLNSILDQA